MGNLTLRVLTSLVCAVISSVSLGLYAMGALATACWVAGIEFTKFMDSGAFFLGLALVLYMVLATAYFWAESGRVR